MEFNRQNDATIEFDMTSTDFIFDEKSLIDDVTEGVSQLEIEIVPGIENGTEDDDRHVNEQEMQLLSDNEAALDKHGLCELTYYPGLRRSMRHTAGIPPSRLGYEEVNLTMETPTQNDDIPTSYTKALKMADADDWLKVMQFEMDTLNGMNTCTWI